MKVAQKILKIRLFKMCVTEVNRYEYLVFWRFKIVEK